MASAPLNWLLKIGGETLKTTAKTLSEAVNTLHDSVTSLSTAKADADTTTEALDSLETNKLNISDLLSLEEIEASTSLAGKGVTAESVKQINDSLGGIKFGITADGEYGYHKEVDGADTVVPFKNTIGFNMFSLHSMANNSYYSVLPASFFKNYKIVFPSRYGNGKLLIYGLKGEYDFSKVQSPPVIPLDKTLLYQIEMSDMTTEYELPEEDYDYFAFWSDWSPSLGKLGVEFNFIPK